MSQNLSPIGVFDSGLGGLTVLNAITQGLPAYDYLYLGDNARSPYGNLSFDTVYEYTLEGVKWLFDQGCELVILACNTASAKALRTIQQVYLPANYPDRRVLGVIRPTAEVIGAYSVSKHIGVLGTRGTIDSGSYLMEIAAQFPDLNIYQQACPMWVPLIENNEHDNGGADYFVALYLQQLLNQSAQIDTILLACTHYPLLIAKIEQSLKTLGKSEQVAVVAQGEIVAQSLKAYLGRHPEMHDKINTSGRQQFYTTGDLNNFNAQASLFLGQSIQAQKARL
ncbi:MAG: glutamate racemase [Pedobacter sp.]|nr:MAG: glutamate racemase [Pedobacter sp.]